MLQTDNFTMRISPKEKKMLATVAKHFERTQAATIKALVREVYKMIASQEHKEPHEPKQSPA